MAYKYHMALDKSYIDFNATPDIGLGVTAGEVVRIEGEIYETQDKVDSISVALLCGSDYMYPTEPYAMYEGVIPKATKRKFSGSFTMPDLSSYNGTNRVGKYSFYMWDWLVNRDASVFYGPISFTYLKYRLAPKITALDFERCTSAGAWADDGQYLRCKALKISKAAQAVVGDFSKKTLVLKDQNGTVKKTVELTTAQLTTMLTSAGYTETKPTLFSGVQTELGLNYTVTLTLGDAYDQVVVTDKVARSFARLHLSGAANGGVAVGQFSAATASKPLFEVASNHASRFYGGVENFGAGALCTASQQALGILCGRDSITLNGATAAAKTVTFQKAFSAAPVVIVREHVIGGDTDAARSFQMKAECSAVTATGFTLKSSNNAANSRGMDVYWVAVGQMGGPAVSDPGLAPPEIVDDTPDADMGIARADYVAMMAGVEIPADAGAAQADPQGAEPPGLDEPRHSEKFELVKLYFDAKVWNEPMVRAAVGRWVTADEAEEIINIPKGT